MSRQLDNLSSRAHALAPLALLAPARYAHVPMGERSRKTPRCTECRMLVPLCICNLIAPLKIRTQVICVLHPMERLKPTNTGHLLEMMLEGAECRVRGERGETLDTHDFNEPSRRTLLLFPSDDARVLDAELLAEDTRPIRLIVPDATWKQASRISRKVEELKQAQRVVLSAGQVSKYQLRRQINPSALCTYEAVTEALCAIEGEALRAPLEQLFRIFVDRTLWSRGEMKASEVTGGITDAVAQWKSGGVPSARGDRRREAAAAASRGGAKARLDVPTQ